MDFGRDDKRKNLKYNIGDLLYWNEIGELSTIVDYWNDMDKRIIYRIETYTQIYDRMTYESISEMTITRNIREGIIILYPVVK
jgi:hypothetical protein